ncbi:TIGR01777 family oxidoreductase [Hellea sp.]|nr:TIGR01777 family oxidoreductase [Hellea sp.]
MTAAPQHIVIGGGSGFIGSVLTEALRARGDRVTWISRQAGEERITWEQLEREGLPVCDVVVNFAGQHILDMSRRWTESYREEVIQSRIRTTKTLVDAINASETPPEAFISTAGKCFYGTKELAEGEAPPELDEYSEPMGMDFPAELVSQWEAAAEGVDTDKVRHIKLRIGVVLGAIERKSYLMRFWRIGKARGFLPIIRLPFCLGLGAVIGKGTQIFPWIHIDDMVGIILHVIDDENTVGRYNAVSPNAVTNRDFTKAFSKYLRRPIIWSVPEWLVKAVVGEERSSILLRGQLVRPRRTVESGYNFKYPLIDGAMADLVKITI